MEEMKRMEYGKRYSVGEYTVIKYNRVLRKQEAEILKNMIGIPAELRKSLGRSQLPYIRVAVKDCMWAVEFCCNTAVYNMLDRRIAEGGKINEAIFSTMFNMWFMDTAIPGDDEYLHDKAEALKAFTERKKAAEEKAFEEEAPTNIVSMKGGEA